MMSLHRYRFDWYLRIILLTKLIQTQFVICLFSYVVKCIEESPIDQLFNCCGLKIGGTFICLFVCFFIYNGWMVICLIVVMPLVEGR